MGFRDMHLFNLSMLAKQGWRLIHHPDTLSSRILKAKYFPDCFFLDAKLGNSPSMIWRSIWEARKVLMRGLRWRVGDGRTIRVWHDRWLSSNPDMKPSTVGVVVNDMATVSDFMDNGTMTWRRDLLNNVFNEDDVNAILAIPISRLRVPDKLIWHYEKSGFFFQLEVPTEC